MTTMADASSRRAPRTVHDEEQEEVGKVESLALWIDGTIHAQHMGCGTTQFDDEDDDEDIDVEQLFGAQPVGLTDAAVRLMSLERCGDASLGFRGVIGPAGHHRLGGKGLQSHRRRSTYSPPCDPSQPHDTGRTSEMLATGEATGAADTLRGQSTSNLLLRALSSSLPDDDRAGGDLVYRAKLDPINAVSTYQAPMSSDHVKQLFADTSSRAVAMTAVDPQAWTASSDVPVATSTGAGRHGMPPGDATGCGISTLAFTTGAQAVSDAAKRGAQNYEAALGAVGALRSASTIEPVPPQLRPVSLLRYTSVKKITNASHQRGGVVASSNSVPVALAFRSASDGAVCDTASPQRDKDDDDQAAGRKRGGGWRKESEQLQAIVASNHVVRASVRHTGVASLSHLCRHREDCGDDVEESAGCVGWHGGELDAQDDIECVLGIWGVVA